MFCSYCGNEVAEGSAFCPHCGSALSAPQQPVEQTVTAGETTVLTENMVSPAEQQESPVQQAWSAEQQAWPAEQQAWSAEQQAWPAEQQVWPAEQQAWPAEQQVWPAEQQDTAYYSQVEPQAPQKRRFPVKGLIAAAVAVVAVVALLLNMGTVVGSVIKTFGSDTAYYQYVELKTVKDGTDTVSDYYALLKDSLTDPEQKVQGSIRPVLGEDAMELLKGLPADVKLDWLNDLKISYTGNYKDNALMLELAIAVAKSDPVKAVGILSMADGKAFAGLPSVSDTYLEVGMNSDVMPDVTAENSALGSLLKDEELLDDLRDILPDDEEMDKLLDRYLAIVLDTVKVSEEEKTTLTVGEIEQKCTQSTIHVTQKMCLDIVRAVLTEAKKDKDIKGILSDVQKFLKERKLDENVDLYAEYGKAVDNALAAIKEVEGEATDETNATMTTYISKQHEVIGRRIKVMDSEVLYYATAQKGSAFATKMTVANMVKVNGSGTRKGDIVNGEYEVEVQGNVVAGLTVKNFDEGKAEEGYLNGSFRLTPKKALLEMAGVDEEFALLFSTYDPSVELVAKNSKNASEMTFNLYKDESVLFGLVFENKTSKADKVKLPKNTVDATDEEALMKWFNDIEGDTVMDKLKTIGLPEEILQLLNTFMAGESVTSAPAYAY